MAQADNDGAVEAVAEAVQEYFRQAGGASASSLDHCVAAMDPAGLGKGAWHRKVSAAVGQAGWAPGELQRWRQNLRELARASRAFLGLRPAAPAPHQLPADLALAGLTVLDGDAVRHGPGLLWWDPAAERATYAILGPEPWEAALLDLGDLRASALAKDEAGPLLRTAVPASPRPAAWDDLLQLLNWGATAPAYQEAVRAARRDGLPVPPNPLSEAARSLALPEPLGPAEAAALDTLFAGLPHHHRLQPAPLRFPREALQAAVAGLSGHQLQDRELLLARLTNAGEGANDQPTACQSIADDLDAQWRALQGAYRDAMAEANALRQEAATNPAAAKHLERAMQGLLGDPDLRLTLEALDRQADFTSFIAALGRQPPAMTTRERMLKVYARARFAAQAAFALGRQPAAGAEEDGRELRALLEPASWLFDQEVLDRLRVRLSERLQRVPAGASAEELRAAGLWRLELSGDQGPGEGWWFLNPDLG